MASDSLSRFLSTPVPTPEGAAAVVAEPIQGELDCLLHLFPGASLCDALHHAQRFSPQRSCSSLVGCSVWLVALWDRFCRFPAPFLPLGYPVCRLPALRHFGSPGVRLLGRPVYLRPVCSCADGRRVPFRVEFTPEPLEEFGVLAPGRDRVPRLVMPRDFTPRTDLIQSIDSAGPRGRLPLTDPDDVRSRFVRDSVLVGKTPDGFPDFAAYAAAGRSEGEFPAIPPGNISPLDYMHPETLPFPGPRRGRTPSRRANRRR